MKSLIFNLQKFSLHDGPGIRTTVFFKGCPLRCAWCANPESHSPLPQLTRDPDKCTGCGLCREDAPLVPERCPAGALKMEGRYIPPEALATELLKDRDFYFESGGGITFSGGEPLLHLDYLERIVPLLLREKVHLAAETTGFGSGVDVLRLCALMDLLLFDVKHVDDSAHIQGTGVSNRTVLRNLALAAQQGKALWVRMPVIPGFNDSPAHVEALGRLLHSLGVQRLHLLPFHRLGADKYRRLGEAYTYQNVPSLKPEALYPLKALAEKWVPQVIIGG